MLYIVCLDFYKLLYLYYKYIIKHFINGEHSARQVTQPVIFRCYLPDMFLLGFCSWEIHTEVFIGCDGRQVGI